MADAEQQDKGISRIAGNLANAINDLISSESSIPTSTKGDIPAQNYDPDSKTFDQQKSEKDRLANERYRNNTSNRNWLTEWATIVVTGWLIIVVLILCLNRVNNIGLSDSVLNVLLGTTTINILGLMYIVLKGYFKDGE